MAIPLLEAIDIAGKDITADALLTQRKFADYLVEKRQAHYYFTVKGNQPGLLADLHSTSRTGANRTSWSRRPPITAAWKRAKSGRPPNSTTISTFRTWAKPSLSSGTWRKRPVPSLDIAYGLTSRTPPEASPRRVLQVNRGHWIIENGCHYVLDWNFDEDRSRIRVGHGPENITRLRRFAIGVIKSRAARSVAQKMRQLTRNMRWSSTICG